MILLKRNASIKWKTANLLFLTFLTLSAVDCGGGWLCWKTHSPAPNCGAGAGGPTPTSLATLTCPKP